MKSIREQISSKPWMGWVLFAATLVIVFFLGLLASSIMERRAEAMFAYTPQVKFESWEPRSAVWGENFPREYQSYLLTSDTSFRSKYDGSAMIDMLETDPRLVVLWAGYAFSKDYNQGRGHFYAITDVLNTLRTGAPKKPEDGPQPATCWTCKSPDVVRLMEKDGVESFYKKTWAQLGSEVVNFIGCNDCHDATTMNLRISRPALVEAFQKTGKDVTKATHQEMRSLVCAQCHVEYYFNKKRVEGAAWLTFPWEKGLSVEKMEEYYDAIEFSDWTHALSKAPMLKAQHPDYEIYTTGIHADRGVSCADCHTPFKSEGGQKFTDHHMTSPLNNVANSCQVCHREETEKLIENVYERQDRIIEIRNELEILLVMAHLEAKKAWDLGASDAQMKDILSDIRKAQWRWDFSAAGHGSSFHSPVEMARVIGNGIRLAQDARVKLARVLAKLGFNEPLPYPDITTKAKAQQFIGLPMDDLRKEKAEFLKTMVPQWMEQAAKREKSYKVTRI
jgi:nitrite reductase (cytochrome c-552)